jgi:hypothetical protein|tara:strand:- start:354 stop:593 length:240 start_codon:yes stop_codon:yes gene_type:complete
MDLVFSKLLSKGAIKLADSLNDSILHDAAENVEIGVKDVCNMFTVMLCSHIETTEGMESVGYDDISEVAVRLKIMLEHQ